MVLAIAAGGVWSLTRNGSSSLGGHLLDGIWVGPTYACTDTPGTGCQIAIATATSLVKAEVPALTVTGAFMAQLLCSPDGRTLCLFGGLWEPQAVIVDLSDGTQRAVELLCGSPREESGVYQCMRSGPGY